MKKTLAMILIAAIAITTIFAADSRDVNIGGAVKRSEYTFSLSYGETPLSDGAIITGVFDLATTSDTENFYVKRTSGNLNNDLSFEVLVQAGPFIGEVNGVENYNTGVIPTISQTYVDTTSFVSSLISNSQRTGTFNFLIPAGANNSSATLLGFIFTITGSPSVPAGNYTSTIQIDYTYEQ
jgi:hypothetical protein